MTKVKVLKPEQIDLTETESIEIDSFLAHVAEQAQLDVEESLDDMINALEARQNLKEKQVVKSKT
jgi:hypothetical protein